MIEPASPGRSAAADELLAAADRVDADFPRAAAWLRALAVPMDASDPRSVRRLVLRQLWRRHYGGVARTTAARLLAAAWRGWAPDEEVEMPGTMSDGFARLARLGVAPLGWRQIADDLDADLDPPDCKFLQIACAARPNARF